MEARITGKTGLLALIGSPVAHSGSPAMYNYSFARLGLDYVYVALDVKEDRVGDAIAAMKLFNMRGGNVTMPDKTEAAKYMDELTPAAKIIGAINTILNENFGVNTKALPLKNITQIVCGNACRIDWNTVCPHTPDEEIFIFGNPP